MLLILQLLTLKQLIYSLCPTSKACSVQARAISHCFDTGLGSVQALQALRIPGNGGTESAACVDIMAS